MADQNIPYAFRPKPNPVMGAIMRDSIPNPNLDALIEENILGLQSAADKKNAETWAENLAKRIPHWRAGGVAIQDGVLVVVIDPDGKQHQMTKVQAKYLAELLWQASEKI